MKELHNPICRSGWSHCDSKWGNKLVKAHNVLRDKLHQSGFVTPYGIGQTSRDV